MRKFYFFAVASIALLFASCNQVCEFDNPLLGSGARFTASLSDYNTRVAGNQWLGNDVIGVFASTATPITSLNAVAQNSLFTNSNPAGTNATFTATPGSANEILFPGDNSTLYFIAYRPRQATFNNTDFTFPINVADQTVDLDFMRATGQGANNATAVNLHFTRSMSKVRLNVGVEAPLPASALAGMTVSINGLNTEGTFNLTTGAVTAPTTAAPIAMVPNGDLSTSTTAVFDAILIPGQFNAAIVTFTAASGDVWTWDVTQQLIMGAGNRYLFPVTLSSVALSAFSPGATIQDWNELPQPPVTAHPPGGTPPPPPPTFEVTIPGGTLPTLPATGGTTPIIALNADAGIDWTITVTGNPWLTIEVDGVETLTGTGSADITISADPFNGFMRTATVTITCDDDPAVYVEFDVTQRGTLLFPGSDFEDEIAFAASTAGANNFRPTFGGTGSSAAIVADEGRNNSAALRIQGTGAFTPGNPDIFNVLAPAGIDFTGKTSISFFLRGTSTMRSLAVTFPSASTGANIAHSFSLITAQNPATSNVTITPTAGNPDYGGHAPTWPVGGSINATDWIKVTLDILSIANDIVTTTGERMMAFRIGGAAGAVWNIFIDDFTVQ